MITKERLEEWIDETGGDPWGYETPFVRDRLNASLEFIQRFVTSDFGGTFLEMGAFNGSFTVKLAAAFPSSRVLANDKAEAAIQQIRKVSSGLSNVSFDLSDLADFRLAPEFAGNATILVMMEMLYYLPKDQQRPALTRLLGELVSAHWAFISGPIQGKDYLDEQILLDLFATNGFEFVAARTLNTTEAFAALHTHEKPFVMTVIARSEAIAPWLGRTLKRAWFGYFKRLRHRARARLDRDAPYRRKHGRQVIYCFRRRPA